MTRKSISKINYRKPFHERYWDYFAFQEHREFLWDRQGGKCCYCRFPTTLKACADIQTADSYATIEHVWPVSLGGDDSMENTLIACRKCNTLRGNMPFPELHLICGIIRAFQCVREDLLWNYRFKAISCMEHAA